MPRRTAIVFALVLGVSLEAGCSSVAGQTVRSDGTPPALQAVLADVSRRPGADARNVQVLRMERRDWSDSGLGCPRPGEFYSQVITPGWLIEVRSGQTVFEYHTDSDDHFVLCGQR